MSVPAVNSSHQRARGTLRNSYRSPAKSANPTNLLERYVRAWEAADVAGLVELLREDAVLTMPPKPTVTGAGQIGTFIGEAIFTIAPMRLLEAHSNGSPAFAAYIREGGGNRFVPFALLVISSDGRHITQIDAFVEPRVLARFELPAELAG
jgi:RNA polymerase sigma-70 factor (ECF subfamily)